ncbi:hypothetical protein EDC05_003341 [Coemansia umbellata]|uniref:Uncharacterized protein n=1 Tax=Coemansia umbellata TaxID=1424467 RepID=A0ABQ8PLC0_9FUNG|nr:hypothetical protein EDC05_003341 [Coemansia umbellata]
MTAGTLHDDIKARFDSVKKGDTKEAAIAVLGNGYTTKDNKLIWTCPGHQSNYISVQLANGVVVDTDYVQS